MYLAPNTREQEYQILSTFRALCEIAFASPYLDGNIGRDFYIGERNRLFDERLILIVNTVSRDAATETPPAFMLLAARRGDRTRLSGMFRSLAEVKSRLRGAATTSPSTQDNTYQNEKRGGVGSRS